MTIATVSPAMGITYLDPKHAPFALTKANEGVATSVVSLEFEYIGPESVPNTIGGLRREGIASGVLLDLGQNNVWMLTAGHNLAVQGRYDEDIDAGDIWEPSFTVGTGSNYFTNNVIDVLDWYVSFGANDDATALSPFDFGLVRLDLTPQEAAAQGIETVSIFSRPQETLVDEIRGETVQIVGFGQSGNGALGGNTFDGNRRWGQNRVEDWLDSDPRLNPELNATVFEVDFDVDRDDDLYDLTPDNFTDLNITIEDQYALKNTGEFTISGGAAGGADPRQVPEEDFRVPFEVGLAVGDSGGGVFIGDSLLGIPISTRAIPALGEDNTGGTDDDTLATGAYLSDSQIITLSNEAQRIADLIFFAEQAEIDFINGDRDDFLLTDNELAALGFGYGAVDLNPLFNFEDQAETNNRRGNADPIDPDGLTDGGGTIGVNDLTAGPAEIQQQSLLISYHLGEPLSDVSKAKLLGILPYYATETLTDEDIIDLIDNPEFTDINDIRDAMVEDLALIYGEPTVDRAIFASQSLGLIANNPDVISRDTGYVADLNQIGDFNGDGGFDADDLDEFIADMNNGDEWTDLNGDGEFNDLDTVAYVSGFLSQLMGDANLDGTVDQADLNKVLNGWGDAGLGWADGNFGGQAAIDQFDLNAVLTNWGSTSAPDLQGFTVPEPAALTLIGLGGLALLCRRA